MGSAITAVVNGKRQPIPHYFKTQAEARRKLTELKRAQDNGLPVHLDRQTVGEYLDHWLELFVKPHRKPKTYVGYYTNMRQYVKPIIGDFAAGNTSAGTRAADAQRIGSAA